MNSQFYCWYNYLRQPWIFTGFPDSLVGKESICNAGDRGSIPGSGRSPGEGIVYPLQYSRASLVAQLVKNPPAVREAWVRSQGWEDPLEKGNYPLQYSGLENSMDCGLPGSSIHGIFQARVLEWGAIAFSGISLLPFN